MLTSGKLYDDETPFERRLAQLTAWVEARRGTPCDRPQVRLMAELLAIDAVTLPFHLIFPDEPLMDLSLSHPTRVGDENPSVDDRLVENFIWRHSDLDRETLERLCESDLRYMALIGLVGWDAAFPTREAYDEAVRRYEVIVEEGVDGNPLFEDEVFWYVAARDFGVSMEEALLYQRLRSIMLFADGIATDDVSTHVLPDAPLGVD